MAQDEKRSRNGCVACGKSGTEINIGQNLSEWSGLVAHPNAPAGGGGPGHFASPPGSVLALDTGSAPAPELPGPARAVPMEGAPAPSAANPPPTITPRSLGVLKEVQDDNNDVKIEGEVLADSFGGLSGRAGTHLTDSSEYEGPNCSVNDKGKIVAINSKFTWHGKITIQTNYPLGQQRKSFSCYGRGTTQADIKAGDITLGFHESCHHDDFIAYLKKHPLPNPPKIKVGMTQAQYDKAIETFDKALKAYVPAAEADTYAKTDEVGHRKSTWESTGDCYDHVVP